jgi:hypothetical protein
VTQYTVDVPGFEVLTSSILGKGSEESSGLASVAFSHAFCVPVIPIDEVLKLWGGSR